MQSLATYYRPQSFSEVIGQDVAVEMLTNQLTNKTYVNAYLFIGSAGTGKTTCARLMSKALDGEVIELDAASNNSVDDIRTMKEQAYTTAISSEYKIFIIDECHALSNSAWQRCLKLIEEPPKNTIFIFCTTDAHKIPNTILSRVQTIKFYPVAEAVIDSRLQYIAKQLYSEGVELDPIASIMLSKKAGGGVRMALSLFEKCIKYSKKVTPEVVGKVLGLGVSDEATAFLVNMDSGNRFECVRILSAVSDSDISEFVTMLTEIVLEISQANIVGVQYEHVHMMELKQRGFKGDILSEQTTNRLLFELIELHRLMNVCKAGNPTLVARAKLMTIIGGIVNDRTEKPNSDNR